MDVKFVGILPMQIAWEVMISYDLSSRPPGLTSSFQGSVNVHRGDLLFMPQRKCISSFVFYIHV